MPDDFETPQEDSEPFKPKEHLKGWLMDPQARDQMVILRGDDVQIVWNHKGAKMEINHERKVMSSTCKGSHSLVLKKDESFAEMDRKVLLMVSIRYYSFHFTCSGCRSMGWC